MNNDTRHDDALDEQWRTALKAFAVSQRAAERSEQTIERRLQQVERFARETGMRTFSPTYEDIRGWLDNMTCTRATMLAYRDSLRAFYRWAFTSRRMREDPAEEPSQRAKRLLASPEWETELVAFRASLRALGRPETTVGVRVSQVSRFARGNPHLGPWDVTLDDILEWFATKRWGADTRRAHRSALRSFYKWAKTTGRTTVNPAKKLPPFKMDQPRSRPALDADYTAALAKADKRERLALRLAGELGMRCAEVAVVHARDLEGRSGAWSLTVHGKGNKPRILPIRDDLVGAIHSMGDGFVFKGNYDGHLSPHHLGKIISALLPPGVTMHMLRHRFATRAYNVDRDVFAVQQLLGHASPATTQRYVKVSDMSMRRLVDAVNS